MSRSPALRRSWGLIVVVLGALAPAGCARDHGQITPTTSGTDLRKMPRGRMDPLPFPGSSLARTTPKADPVAVLARSKAGAGGPVGRWWTRRPHSLDTAGITARSPTPAPRARATTR